MVIPGVPHGRVPDFLLVGFPKAGTTSLAGWLSDHPDVFVPLRKEVDFFNQHWAKGLSWYEQQFQDAGPAQALGDASPRYVVHPPSHARIAETLPGAKILVLVREPVARAVSHYWYVCDALRRELPPMSELVERELLACDAEPGTGTVAWGRYDHYLELLARHVDRDRIRVYTLDALHDRPDEVFIEVCEFLDVDPAPRPLSVGSTRNPAFRHRSERLFTVMVRHQLFRRLPRGLGLRLDELNRAPVARRPVDPAVLTRLREHYAPHNAALTSWIGELPPSWSV